MAKKRTITISVETDQLLIVRTSQSMTGNEQADLTNKKLEQLPVTVDIHSVIAAEAFRSAVGRTIHEITRNFTKKG